MAPSATTIVDVLRRGAEERDEAIVYRYLRDGCGAGREISFGQLERDSFMLAARLRVAARRGDRALIIAEDAIDFSRAFLACQIAGVIAVPVSPPFPSQRGRRVETLRAIARDCRAGVLLTAWSEELQGRLAQAAPELAWLPRIAVDIEAAASGSDQMAAVGAEPGDAAFLQYTSGSTSLPRGVVVTHEMLMHNEALIAGTVGMSEDDVLVSWLPLFHDMGLIGSILGALYARARAVIMPPSAFARWPLHWLEAISDHGGTVTAGPDSAYALCVEKTTPEQRAGLDLSSLRVAVNGSEPVSSATLEAFSETFGPCGFRPSAWFATYGLAECTLMATAPHAGLGPARLRVQSEALRDGRLVPGGDRVLVGCGTARMHRGVAIVDPDTGRRLAPGEVGEIWLSGPDVAQGYWPIGHGDATAFTGEIDDRREGPFLRTGDLGALHDGELFVVGRLKDVIIIGGRNHYPHDIEATVVGLHDALVSGACVAFGVECEGREQLVVVAGVVAGRLRSGVDLEAIALTVRAAVASEHGIAVADVVLVERKAVPRTSSGKPQRRACCTAYERGELELAVSFGRDGRPLPAPTIEQRRQTLRALIVEQIERILQLGTDGVDTTLPFQQLGLDSLMTAELHEQLEAALGERVPATMFFAHPTTEQLIEHLLDDIAPRERGLDRAPGAESHAPESAAHADELAELDERALAEMLGDEIVRIEGILRQ